MDATVSRGERQGTRAAGAVQVPVSVRAAGREGERHGGLRGDGRATSLAAGLVPARHAAP